MQQIQDVITSDDVLDTLDLLKFTIMKDGIPCQLDPLFIYCNKTGHPIAKREISSVYSSIENRGKDFTFSVLYNSYGLCIHPQWAQTDARTLDESQIFDPIGYVTYCLGLMTDRFYQKAFASRAGYANANAEKYWAIARTNALLRTIPRYEIEKLSNHCCHLLTFAPETLAYFYRVLGKLAQTPDTLAFMATKETLIPAIERAIESALHSIGIADRAIQRARFQEIAATPTDMARGPSQIRGQKRSRRKLQTVEVDFFFQQLSGMNLDSVHAARVKAHDLTTKPLDIDLEALASIDLEAMEMWDDDEDDNEVIVRRIPRSAITGQLVNVDTYQPPQPKRSSFLSKITPQPPSVLLVAHKAQGTTMEQAIATTTSGNSFLKKFTG